MADRDATGADLTQIAVPDLAASVGIELPFGTTYRSVLTRLQLVPKFHPKRRVQQTGFERRTNGR